MPCCREAVDDAVGDHVIKQGLVVNDDFCGFVERNRVIFAVRGILAVLATIYFQNIFECVVAVAISPSRVINIRREADERAVADIFHNMVRIVLDDIGKFSGSIDQADDCLSEVVIVAGRLVDGDVNSESICGVHINLKIIGISLQSGLDGFSV